MSSENNPTHKRTTDEIKTLLELPFRVAEITWRVLGMARKQRVKPASSLMPIALHT